MLTALALLTGCSLALPELEKDAVIAGEEFVQEEITKDQAAQKESGK